MLKEFAEHFLNKSKKEQEVPENAEQGPALSQDVTFGAHLYRRKGEIAEVVFTHRARHIQRIIVDDDGRICGFPGFYEPEEITRHMEDGKLPEPVIRFRTDFQKEPDGRFLMVWEVQPDGRYWEDDDGFGGTSDPEICLYSYIDEEGRFTNPFRIYNIGVKIFFKK